MVLDRGGDEMAAGVGRAAQKAEKREIVGLGAAAGEDDFLGIAVEERGDLTAGHFEALLGDLAVMMDTGGVAGSVAQHGGEGFKNLGRDGRGRIVIEVSALHGGYFSV